MKLLHLSLMASILATTENEYYTYGKPKHYRNKLSHESAISEISKLTEDQKKEKSGLKKFVFGENIIWAINQKNADKKARKLGLIL